MSPDFEPPFLARLRPHQVLPVAQLSEIFQRHNSALDLSDTGTGKTYVAACVAAMNKLPTLCVVPKIAVPAWERAAEHFDTEFSIIGYEKLRAGNTPFGAWQRQPVRGAKTLKCINCQCVYNPEQPFRCYCRPDGIHCVETRSAPRRYGKFSFDYRVKQIIFDEVHRCNGMDSLNADMLIAARRQNIKVLGLSATAFSSPLQLHAIGWLLDFFRLPDFPNWLRRQGCRYTEWGGWQWLVSEARQREILAGIRAQIIPERGVRVRTTDIPDFPERNVSAELYSLDEPGRVTRLYAEMRESLERLKVRAALDKSPDHPLTKILRAKQEIELLKVPVFLELLSDDLAKGRSVGLFVNYRETIVELSARLRKLGVEHSIIQGEQSAAERQLHIEKFQDNRHRAALINSYAGGITISLQDLDGYHPRSGYISPPWSAVVVKQLLGRFHRDGGRSACYYRFVYADSPDERKSRRKLESKLNNIDALNDSDLTPESFSFNV